jgi:hypothetical protein
MFRSTKKRMAALLDIVDDMLVGAPEVALEPETAPHSHPHRRPAGVRIERRAGAVTPRAMHCTSPIRPAAPAARPARDAVAGNR